MTVKCGLVSESGNPVPLKKVCVDVTVSGFVVHVQSDLHYANEEDVAIETTFTFPLDDGAAVYRLEAEIEGRRIIAECQEKQQHYKVPLKKVCVDVTVSGFVAHVQSDLHYANEEDVAIETTFTFPLDDGAAVYRLEAEIEGRRIIAECQEKQQAKQTYDDAIASGRTAMHLAEHDKTGDIFKCTLGNLPPYTDAKLTLSYVLELPQEHDGKLRFTLPTVLNPRYSPDDGFLVGPDEAMQITGNVPSGDDVPCSDDPYTLQVTATVRGKREVRGVTSVTDVIHVEYSPDKLEAKVRSDVEDFKFDHDLTFLVEYEDLQNPQVIVEKGDPEKDSMGFRSDKIIHARDALLFFLKSLPVGCYFNIVSFGSSFVSLFPEGSKEYTEKSLSKAVALQRVMEADMGGTEILSPLRVIYSKPTINGHPRQLFLLTDGEVWNVDEVIGITKKNANNTRVFALGIGEGASTSLVKGVARAGRGKAEFITDSERMQPKVMSLLRCAMQPSITSLDVSWKLPSGVSAVTIPAAPATLFGGDQLVLYALLQGKAKKSKSSYAVTIKGKTEKEAVKLTVCFDTDCVESPDINAPLHRLAAKTQIKLLQDSEDEDNGGAKADMKKKIILLSTASNMVSRYTSFVAVDRDRKQRVEGAAVQCHVPIPVPSVSRSFLSSMRPSLVGAGRGQMRSVKRSSKMQNSGASTGITVHTLTGKAVGCTTLTGTSTVAELKAHLQDKEGIPPDQQRLIIDGRQAEDDQPLEDFGDTANMAVHLVLRLRGGGGEPPDPDKLKQEQEERERKEQEQYDKRMLGDPLMQMVSFQTFQGSWELSTDVCTLLNVDMETVKTEAIFPDTTLVATLLVVAWLNNKWSSRKDEWEMIERKAIIWIKSHDLKGRSVSQCIDDSRKMLVG